ncbi:hypothetical protein, partial [Bacillus sp. SIMBA_005]|uniref:hypothetical protein n=1 Tax=Bacillus sp. SIMBA_005 TaxID=3085754 RepID=UPI00397A81B2
IAGQPGELERLAKALESFAASKHQSLILQLQGYRIAGAQLRLTKDPTSRSTSYFSWLVTPLEVSRIVEQLLALPHSAPAHQYFELV